MAKYLPFDFALLESYDFSRLPAFPLGLVHLLVIDYWKTGFDLPESDHDLAILLKTDIRTWLKHKPAVTQALATVMPNIVETRKERVRIREMYQSYMLNARKQLKKGQSRKIRQLSDKPSTHTPIVPIPVPRNFQEGKSDKHLVKQAKDSKQDETWFTDD